MRTITRIILHCTASIAGVHLSGNDIRSYHCNPVRLGGRGWRRPPTSALSPKVSSSRRGISSHLDGCEKLQGK